MQRDKKRDDMLPEVFVSDRAGARAIGRMVRAGTARKIGPRLYTRNMRDAPEAVVVSSLWPIVALLAPGTVVSHRTAFENRAAPDGSVFLSGPYPRQIVLPGVTLRQVQGSGPVAGDMPYMGTLHLASRPRAFLENLLPSRRREMVTKTVGRDGVEERLAEALRAGGEEALNRIRDEARALAPLLGLEEQYRILDGLVAALLRSRPARLATPVARAYAEGEPYDPARLPLLTALFAALRAGEWPVMPDRSLQPPPASPTTATPSAAEVGSALQTIFQSTAFQNCAFFDAYFSNYIEGTEFPIEQAIRIVFEGEIPASRPADAHDVLGTYRLVGSQEEMSRLPQDFGGFLDLSRCRHAVVMEGRPEKLPGRFKETNNQAGATTFVEPALVVGTLRQGFGMYQALSDPFARALMMMFLVAEVHPFADGNGRVARVMMNAELVAAGQTRILIPSVYRNEYVASLKRLTNYQDPAAFLRVMRYAQSFVSRIDFTDLKVARRTLAAHNAFDDPADDVKLKMPSELHERGLE